MRHFILIVLTILVMAVGVVAHESPENKARVIVQHGSLTLELSLHPNKWTEGFKVHKLDDGILKETKLSINSKKQGLKFKKIQKRDGLYFIKFIGEKGVEGVVKNASLTLPKNLGDVVVTFVRSSTKFAHEGKSVSYTF